MVVAHAQLSLQEHSVGPCQIMMRITIAARSPQHMTSDFRKKQLKKIEVRAHEMYIKVNTVPSKKVVYTFLMINKHVKENSSVLISKEIAKNDKVENTEFDSSHGIYLGGC